MPAFRLTWRDGQYRVSSPNIGDTDCYTAEQVERLIRYAAPPAAAVLEGYALVPVEPTREMRRAAIGEYEDAMDARLPDGDGYDEEVVTRLYRAMLAAAERAKGE